MENIKSLIKIEHTAKKWPRGSYNNEKEDVLFIISQHFRHSGSDCEGWLAGRLGTYLPMCLGHLCELLLGLSCPGREGPCVHPSTQCTSLLLPPQTSVFTKSVQCLSPTRSCNCSARHVSHTASSVPVSCWIIAFSAARSAPTQPRISPYTDA